MTNYEREQSTQANDSQETKKNKPSRRGLLALGAVGAATGVGLFVGIPEYQKRKAEAEKQEAKQEYLSQTNAITQLLIDQINDPSYSVDGSTPYYDYDSESELLVFHSAERDSFLDSLTNVSISYRVADQETDLYNASADVLYTTVQSSQPARLEVYQDSSFGGTVNYIVMDVNGDVFYNHAFGEDGFENPYDDLPVTDIGYIQPTLDSAQKIVTNEGSELY